MRTGQSFLRGTWACASFSLLLGCLELGTGPALPVHERFAAQRASQTLIVLHRRDAATERIHTARYERLHGWVLEPRFAPSPWQREEMTLFLSALYLHPLFANAITLSYDPHDRDHLIASDRSGRVVRIQLNAASEVQSLKLEAGFHPALAAAWTVLRIDQELVLRGDDGTELRFY